ncbi:Gfo/Idh/MocA family protein [Alkalihalobacillus sp. BA299]|uniref:Gfo/Idh/MocA family protein n=1 Tax=Alkalihalobacillus sp. BA299 TaxID=2815938 RepID=UPI001ADA318E|nr:Gfo/Idh/MocA family oxidoreductase [Alkalihalobacillus sp. BA299]
MKKVINWGILGDAGIAKKAVIPAIQRATNATVMAIASQKGAPQQTADQFHISKAYPSYHQLLTDPDIDAVYIPLPNALHKEWVIEAARNNKHILCEKPAALTSAEVEEMLAICQKQNVQFMEAFMYQFHPQHERVRQVIEEGEIGVVQQMNSRFTYLLNLSEDNIRLNQKLGGGSLYDVGCYCIHASRSILQEEPVSVYCDGRIDTRHNVDLTAHGVMSFPQNVVATFTCSFEQFPVNDYEIIGTKGKIIVPHAFRPDKQSGIGEIKIINETGSRSEKVEGDQYRAQIEHFSKAILEQFEPTYNGEQTIWNMRVMDACFQSIAQKSSIEVSQ